MSSGKMLHKRTSMRTQTLKIRGNIDDDCMMIVAPDRKALYMGLGLLQNVYSRTWTRRAADIKSCTTGS